ncbi:MAG: hypothetical protein NWQ07_10510 [Flaviramulus sp.]|nr:hypothetical protein [Flaviramulus sp.]
MDELDILKKDWNKANTDYKKLSVKDIYPLLQKKSSSIVKTLFYISIAELMFWILINSIPYFYSDEYRQKLEIIYSNEYVLTGITFLTYGIILLFIYLLYNSYKSISVTDNAKNLMKSIIKTRNIIKCYVIYNLVIAGVSLIFGFYHALNNDPNIASQIENFSSKELAIAYAIMIICTVIFILIVYLFYKIIYGFLLKRLNKNYNELEKLEV